MSSLWFLVTQDGLWFWHYVSIPSLILILHSNVFCTFPLSTLTLLLLSTWFWKTPFSIEFPLHLGKGSMAHKRSGLFWALFWPPRSMSLYTRLAFTTGLYGKLGSLCWGPLCSSFFCRPPLAVPVLLPSHVNFRIGVPIPTKSTSGPWLEQPGEHRSLREGWMF